MELLHPDIEFRNGSDSQELNAPGDITFSVAPEWEDARAEDGEKFFADRKTLVVVEGPDRKIRQVGLVDAPPILSDNELQVTCGGFSMIAGQSGPWEGHQGYYVTKDPVTLFRDIWKQVQTYKNSNLGVTVTGDTRSGAALGTAGSRRYQNARRNYNRYKPELEKWESRVVARERILHQRMEKMFKAAGVKRVGDVNVTTNEPDDPGYKANSTVWVHESKRRAYRFRNGRWVSQSQADNQVDRWLKYRGTLQRAKDEVDRLTYLAEPAKELMEKYEELHEGREEYSLYFWQNHDMGEVIEELTEIGPFEYREESTWDGITPKLSLRVGSPKLGTRRRELHLEIGFNVLDLPPFEPGELYTGVAMFGAGEGSEVLSQQRDWNPKHAVRRIFTETDKDAYTKQLTRNAANKALKELKKQAVPHITELVITYGPACPRGSFKIGDILFVTGVLQSGRRYDEWVRVVSLSHQWGEDKVTVEVEPA